MTYGCCLWIGCLSVLAIVSARAQVSPPASPDPDVLFRNQCGTCHTLSDQESARQGPPLGGVFGRKAGAVVGFKYSPGLTATDFAWDAQRLDAWLTNPQSVIPGAIMAYRQANPATRHAIIEWLKEQH